MLETIQTILKNLFFLGMSEEKRQIKAERLLFFLVVGLVDYEIYLEWP